LNQNLIDIWNLATHPDQWITRAGAYFVTLSIFTLGLPVLFWLLPTDFSKIESLSCIIIWLVVSFGFWFAYAEYYLRNGIGRKIGLAFEGYRTNSEDIKKARSRLEELAADSILSDNINLKLLPLATVKSKKRLTKCISKYNFDMILLVEMEPTVGEPGFHFTTNLTYSPLAGDTKSIDAAMQLQSEIVKSAKINIKRPSDVLTYASDRFFDLILYAVFICELLSESAIECIRVADILDKRIAESVDDVWKSPRAAIRLLACDAIIVAAAKASNEKTNSPEPFTRASNILQIAIDNGFATQFPLVYHNEARNQFYLGNLETAIELVSFDELYMFNKRGKSYFYLARAVLFMFNTQWKNAADNYNLFLDGGHAKEFPWDSILEFISDAKSMGYPATEFLFAIYTKLKSDDIISDEILLEAKQWLFEDRSRECLRPILERIINDNY
jgi:hypothetical protein